MIEILRFAILNPFAKKKKKLPIKKEKTKNKERQRKKDGGRVIVPKH